MVAHGIPSGRELELNWHGDDSFKVKTFAQNLSRISDPQTMLNAAISNILQAIPHADGGVISLSDRQMSRLKVYAACGYGRKAFDVQLLPGKGAGPGIVFETGSARLWQSANECAGLIANLTPDSQEALFMARQGLEPSESVICAPVPARYQPIGSIHLEHCSSAEPFSMPDLALLWALANQLAVSWFSLLLTQRRQRTEEMRKELLEMLHSHPRGLIRDGEVVRLFDRLVDQPAFEEAPDLRGDAAIEPVLTDRELEVLQLVASSKSNRDIARQLCISVKTVQTHRANIMRKLDLHDRTELVRYAIRTGLVAP
ncbi:MAG TPA: LuxR C-terminal-related transcriptional regulator [Bellilinea sp.]|nr:LuxR C-terminal-related transcriptional regulator [Bellilinea sp.]